MSVSTSNIALSQSQLAFLPDMGSVPEMCEGARYAWLGSVYWAAGAGVECVGGMRMGLGELGVETREVE